MTAWSDLDALADEPLTWLTAEAELARLVFSYEAALSAVERERDETAADLAARLVRMLDRAEKAERERDEANERARGLAKKNALAAARADTDTPEETA